MDEKESFTSEEIVTIYKKLKTQKEYLDVLFQMADLFVKMKQYSMVLQPEGIAYLENLDDEKLAQITAKFKKLSEDYKNISKKFKEEIDLNCNTECSMWLEDYEIISKMICEHETRLSDYEAAFASLLQKVKNKDYERDNTVAEDIILNTCERIVWKNDIGYGAVSQLYQSGLLWSDAKEMFSGSYVDIVWHEKQLPGEHAEHEMEHLYETWNEQKSLASYLREYVSSSGYEIKIEEYLLRSKRYPFMIAEIFGYVTIPNYGKCILIPGRNLHEKLDVYYNEVLFYMLHNAAVTGIRNIVFFSVETGLRSSDDEVAVWIVELDDALIEWVIHYESLFWNRVQTELNNDWLEIIEEAEEQLEKLLDAWNLRGLI